MLNVSGGGASKIWKTNKQKLRYYFHTLPTTTKKYMSHFQISNSSNSDPIKRMSKRRDTKVSVLVLWMNIAFFTCWMPYGIVALCYIFGGEGFVNPLIVVIPLLASKSSVCWNPMLYIVMNFQVRPFVWISDQKAAIKLNGLDLNWICKAWVLCLCSKMLSILDKKA